MGNSKTLGVERKHRQRRAAAKEQVRAHLAGKLPGDQLSVLARRYLERHLRVTKK
jgi:hypothetical protein